MAGGVSVQSKLEWPWLVELTWANAAVAVWQMKALVLTVAILYSVLDYAGNFIFIGVNRALLHIGTERFFLEIADKIFTVAGLAVQSMLLAPVAVAVHRFVLLNETPSGWQKILHPRILRFAVWTFWLEVAAEVGDLCGTAASSSVVKFAIFAIIVVVFARTLLIFPDVAIDIPAANLEARFDTAWTRSRELFWAIFWSTIVAMVPIICVTLMPGLMTALLAAIDLLPLSMPSYRTAVCTVLEELFAGILMPLQVAVLASLASCVYLWRQEHPVAAVTPTATPT